MTETSAPPNAYDRASTYVSTVYRLCEDPGKRAALRSGLARPITSSPRMHSVIAARVPLPREGEDRDTVQQAYYAIASMIASLPPQARGLPSPGARRNFGVCLAEAVARGTIRETSAESRLTLLTRQNERGLHRHLPTTALFISTRPGTLDWAQLLLDLRSWDREREETARNWLQDYYRTRFKAEREAARLADENDHPND
ncbi:type I-E CRISPR-associated protein Cse2/CasB [Actinocorallia sp. A-T 12471]|uniref:type I-E CRISPR-associated protein Cse2/CasB n=1 Tax=Actinocorallia sp. A-T 12471 TaxID=3089813 RepID=UPI0029CC77A5|nr:type I-E CRISPR-associated protein Cse2/CasB [Actinocorallia sp. A-T 12471]MDX6740253.1 type I-E CRISPR-associated protein Cse2/CasB [Actinocorallia sp. A-T 12471]